MADAVPEDLQVLLLEWNRAQVLYEGLTRRPRVEVLPMGDRIPAPVQADALDRARQDVLRLAAAIFEHPANVAARERMAAAVM
jgi:hypothetical protein